MNEISYAERDWHALVAEMHRRMLRMEKLASAGLPVPDDAVRDVTALVAQGVRGWSALTGGTPYATLAEDLWKGFQDENARDRQQRLREQFRRELPPLEDDDEEGEPAA
jgi:hypothetical protein